MNNALFEAGCVGRQLCYLPCPSYFFKLLSLSLSFFFLCGPVAAAVGYKNKIFLAVLLRCHTAFKTWNLFQSFSLDRAVALSSDPVLIQKHCTTFMLLRHKDGCWKGQLFAPVSDHKYLPTLILLVARLFLLISATSLHSLWKHELFNWTSREQAACISPKQSSFAEAV